MTVLANARRLGRILRVLIAHGLSMQLPRAAPGALALVGVAGAASAAGQSLAPGAAARPFGGHGRDVHQARPDAGASAGHRLLRSFATPYRICSTGWHPFPVRGGRADLPGGAGQAAFRDLRPDRDGSRLATASIGQVHVAYLNGQKLAVKVQRPSVDRRVLRRHPPDELDALAHPPPAPAPLLLGGSSR